MATIKNDYTRRISNEYVLANTRKMEGNYSPPLFIYKVF